MKSQVWSWPWTWACPCFDADIIPISCMMVLFLPLSAGFLSLSCSYSLLWIFLHFSFSDFYIATPLPLLIFFLLLLPVTLPLMRSSLSSSFLRLSSFSLFVTTDENFTAQLISRDLNGLVVIIALVTKGQTHERGFWYGILVLSLCSVLLFGIVLCCVVLCCAALRCSVLHDSAWSGLLLVLMPQVEAVLAWCAIVCYRTSFGVVL